MNKLILEAMDRNNHTKAELNSNSVAAAHAGKDGGYHHAPANIAACAADAAWLDDVDCPADAAHVEYWINSYFKVTGEDNNKFVLIVVDRENRTQEELKRNAIDAAACAAADAAAYSDAAAYAKYWVIRYFEITGENRQDYIDAIKEGKG